MSRTREVRTQLGSRLRAPDTREGDGVLGVDPDKVVQEQGKVGTFEPGEG